MAKLNSSGRRIRDMKREDLISLLLPLSEKEILYKKGDKQAFMDERNGFFPQDGIVEFAQKDYISQHEGIRYHQSHGEIVSGIHALDLKDVFFNKQTRYSIVPVHRHTYVEINYVYHGKCTAVINGKTYELETGDLCVLDQNVSHTIKPLADEDLVLNALLKKEAFNRRMLESLENSGIIADFVAKAISDTSRHDSFLLLHTNPIPAIRENFENILCEYLDPGIGSKVLIENYLSSFLILLARCYQENKEEQFRERKNPYLTTILRYIEDNCTQCTLEKTAYEFGFHPNSLSRLIRKQTGRTFKSIVDDSRLSMAAFLLVHTAEPVSEIAARCGWSNVRQFYEKFKQRYHVMPKQFRSAQKDT